MDGRTASAALGVSPGATRDELVRAFRARAKIAHPDLDGTDEAFVLLRSAFELLLASTTPAGRRSPVTPATPARVPSGDPGSRGASVIRERRGAWFVSRPRPVPGMIDLTDKRSRPSAGRSATSVTTARSPASDSRRFAALVEAELSRRSR